MKTSTLKSWFWVHKWTSLISMIFLLILCVTGLPLIFHEEIDHALGYSGEAPGLPGMERTASIDAMIAHAQARNPGDVMQFVVRDSHEPDAWFIRLGESPNGAITAYDMYDARTGELLNEYPLEQGIMNVVLRLHTDLFAGLPGTLFLGFMGVLLVASIVSGAVLYAPFAARLRFGTVRRDRSARLKWLDMHNAVGIITMVWLLVVGATGVVNALSTPIFAQWQATELAEMTAPYRGLEPVTRTGSVDAAVEAARSAVPEMELSFMAFPGNAFASPHHFVAFMHGRDPLTSRLIEPVLIDARTAEVLEVGSMPWYVSTLMLSQPLHFGDYGGMPLKVIWAVLTAVSIVVLWSGLVLWVKRRDRSFADWLARARASEPTPVSVEGRVA
ncbi:MAG: PepSY domain-containing protein [Longimicrobiales bacterium]|nr:PepSY domain-containing protein [Longimicrobiales bacterium]